MAVLVSEQAYGPRLQSPRLDARSARIWSKDNDHDKVRRDGAARGWKALWTWAVLSGDKHAPTGYDRVIFVLQI